MAIYYTAYEGGDMVKLPVNTSHRKVMKQIRNNKGTIRSTHTHIKLSHVRYPLLVHSLFFVKNGVLKKCWDSSLNRYRGKPWKGLKLLTIK